MANLVLDSYGLLLVSKSRP